jgi:hypothetical protein
MEYQRLPVADADPLEEQLRDFLRVVSSGRPPLVSGEAGRRALGVAIRVSELIQEQLEQLGGTFGLEA